MSERDKESFKSVQLEQHAADSSNAHPEVLQSNPSAPSSTVTQSIETEEKTSPPASEQGQKWATAVNQFKLRRFFVLRVICRILFLVKISNCAVFTGDP